MVLDVQFFKYRRSSMNLETGGIFGVSFLQVVDSKGG